MKQSEIEYLKKKLESIESILEQLANPTLSPEQAGRELSRSVRLGGGKDHKRKIEAMVNGVE